jgi:glycerate 2-kinase
MVAPRSEESNFRRPSKRPGHGLIRNWSQICARGNTEGREIVLDIIAHALSDVDSYDIIKRLVKVRNKLLMVGPLTYNLRNINQIVVVGAGKQVSHVAAALEDILGSNILTGLVIEKRGGGRKARRIDVLEGGHPIPDESCVKGTKRIVEIAKKAGKNDLVIVCVTGGCTALTTLPPKDIPFGDIQKVFSLLLKSGMPVGEMNTIRKHLSQVGGGKLAQMIHPAETLGLIAVDEVDGGPWGPTVPDTTTFEDAKETFMKYDLWTTIPPSVREYIETADSLDETPKRTDFNERGFKVHNVVFADNKMLCSAAVSRATQLGLRAVLLSTRVEGEAKVVGTLLAGLAKEIEANGRPFRLPCALVAGGETTVTISSKAGEGGRNQELALAAGIKISGSKGIVLASVGSDGTDGPTDIAGAVVDGYVLDEARNAGLDLPMELKKHNSSHVVRTLRDAIYLFDTKTNLMDLIVVYVGQKRGTSNSIKFQKPAH